VTKGLRINRSKPQNWGASAGAPPPWDGAWLTPRNTLLLTCVIGQNVKRYERQ